MNRSLTKCLFVAFGAGLLSFAAIIGMDLLFSCSAEYFHPDEIAVFLLKVLSPFVFAFAIAVYAGRHDKVAFITCAVPAIAIGLIDYITILQFRMEMAARHSMGSMVTGPGFFILLPWAFVLGVAGIGLKRFVEKLRRK
ncbi:MAG: hypothetical protein ABIP97_09210 [Chthoniobacterales bacterium]